MQSLSFEQFSVERKGWSVILTLAVFPLMFSWLIYIMASFSSEGKGLTLLRKINIVLPIFLILVSIWILPNFVNINNEVLWQRWANSMGLLAIISMITEITTFFIKKQN
jgi:hypothetical protein